MNKFKANDISIKKIFEVIEEYYFIPAYQRKYTWDKEYIKTYWNDINKFNEKEGQIYFLGNIIIKSEEENNIIKKEVVDGQQRLTTNMLLLIAIRNIINKSFNNNDSAKEIVNEIERLIKPKPTNPYFEKEFKIKIVNKNYEDYFNKVWNNNVDKESNSSSRYIQNYLFFYKELYGKKIEELSILYYKLSKIVVVEVMLGEKDDPLVIFKNVNSKNKELTVSELFKNLMLLKVNNLKDINIDYKEKLNDEILEIFDKLIDKNFKKSHEQNKFFRMFCSLFDGKLIKLDSKEIYQKIELEIENKYSNEVKKTEEVIDFLKEVVTKYEFLKGETNSILRDKIIDKLFLYKYDFLINRLFDQYFIWLFFSMKTQPLKGNCNYELTEELKDMINFVTKYYLFIEFESHSAGQITRFIPTLPFIMNERGIEFNTKNIQEYLMHHPDVKDKNHKLPTIDEIKNSFLNLMLSQVDKPIIRYFFGLIEHISGHEVYEWKQINDFSIEHIMPQSLDSKKPNDNVKKWRRKLGPQWEEIYNKYINSIGNLTLLTIPDNSSIKDISFKEKQNELFKRTKLYINNYLLNEDTWIQENIENRIKWLFEQLQNKKINMKF